ncbi:MAG: HD domain-containing protein [Lachnospiraceae bacterium]|nr:HD domain-containing protein [Lachnospiraceae bacterium]
MINYFLLSVILSGLFLSASILDMRTRRMNYYFSFIHFAFFLANCGYLGLALSTNLEQALTANKATYIGGCFATPIMFFAICYVCNYRVGKWVRFFLYAYCMFVYVLVLRSDFNDFYYKKVEFGQAYGVSTVFNEHGPGYKFFYILLFGFIFSAVALLVYTYLLKSTVSRKNVRILLAMEVVTISVFVIGRNVAPDFEFMPGVYVIDGILFLYLNRRLALYNVQDNITESLLKKDNYAFVMFDNTYRYLGSNTVAFDIIPGIEKCRVDSKIQKGDMLDFFVDWIDEYSNNALFSTGYYNGGKYYEVTVDRIWYNDKAKGYLVELADETSKHNYVDLLSKYNKELEDRVNKQDILQHKMLIGMANIVENRDYLTGGHVKRTSDVVRILIDTIRQEKLFNWSDEFCDNIIKAAPMHDLGKIVVDDSVLKKVGYLTDDEFAQMKKHPEKSVEFITEMFSGMEDENFLEVALNIAHYHHERWDGTGYPEGLKGEEIPIEARLMAVADVYDALVTERCYKAAMDFSEADAIMEEKMGPHFDIQFKPVYELSRERLEAYYRETRLVKSVSDTDL